MKVEHYKIRVTLQGFKREINRTMLINDNVELETFCRAIITAMNGDLSHLYNLKYKNKYYIMNEMELNQYNEVNMGSLRISELDLSEKDKMIINYDYGDNWNFEITIQKIIKGHNDKNIVVLAGKGKGIEDDCGGIYGLWDLIQNKDNDWGYDIDDFNIDEINEELDKYYNKK